jgi:hypothetical protein
MMTIFMVSSLFSRQPTRSSGRGRGPEKLKRLGVDLLVVRCGHQVFPMRGLSNSGIATQDEDTTSPSSHIFQQPVE